MRSIFLEKPDVIELRLKTYGWRQALVWLPALLAICVIAVESTDMFSAAHTKGWLRPLLQRLLVEAGDGTWDELNHLLRKSGHFCGYGMVCLMFLRAWLIEQGRMWDLGVAEWRRRSCLLAVISTALIASMDEWHQSYIPSRTGTPVDVALDTCGAIFTCGVVWVFFWRMQRDRRMF